MMTRTGIATGLACGIWLSMALSGCASVDQVAQRVVDTNVVQEMATNQMMLLNIIRASHHEGMHHSRIGAITLPVASSDPLAYSLPLGGGSNHTYTVSGKAGGGLITVETQPQDSQEFMQGITRPVTLSLLDFYLKSGWPQELLLHLFIKRIQVGDQESPFQTFDNYPMEPDKFARFQRAVRQILACRPVVKSNDPEPVGPALSRKAVDSVEGLVTARQAGLSFRALDGNAVQLQDPATGSHWIASDRACNVTEEMSPLGLALRSGDALYSMRDRQQDIAAGGSRPKTGQAAPKVLIDLRSVDGMLYYLGEVVRAERAYPGSITIEYGRPAKKAALFRVTVAPASPGPGLSHEAVVVSHRGERAAVGRGSESDRSMQVLALMNQLLQLQNKAAKPPAPVSVRLIGQ